MKQKSIKVNAVLNLIRNLMGMLFPLITFPYASRILLPEGLGRVNFATSIVTYFTLLASLGISSYGIREAAKIRDDKYRLSRFTKEVFVINVISTTVAYCLLFAAIFCVPKLYEYRVLLIVCSGSILFTTLGLDWLYSAVENFTYTTVRSIAFQFISLILLFTFIHDSDDYIKYAAITVLSTVGSNILNFVQARKYISFRNIPIRLSDLKKHLSSVLVLFVVAISGSIYSILDTSMLGFLSTDYEVGLYAAATKVNRIVLNLVVAIGPVLLPRLSYYYGLKQWDKFQALAYKLIDLLMLLSVPAAIGLSLLAPEVIELLSGEAYSGAVPVMRVINPLVVIVSISNFVGVQIFMPLKKEKWTLYSNLVGVSVNITANALLIPSYGALGAAMGSLLTEFMVTTTQLLLVRKFLSVKMINGKFAYYFVFAALMGCGVAFMKGFAFNMLSSLLLGMGTGVCIYAAMLIIVKNQWAVLFLEMLKKRMSK